MRTWKVMFVVTSDKVIKEETQEGVERPLRGRTEAERNAVRQRRVNRLERRWWGRKAVNVFIVWHLFALTIWLTPSGSAIDQSPLGVGLVRCYMTLTSFAQSWSMFSPCPDKLDVTLEAQITYTDGEKRFWFFPRMAHMDYVRRYQEERWRKLVEVATHGNSQAVWQGLARYAARANDHDRENRPVSVELFQHSRLIPPPGNSLPPIEVTPLQTGSGPFIAPIHPEDLR